MIGNGIEIRGHLQIAIVDHIETALVARPRQCPHTGGREIVGMDVVGVDIFARDQRRRASLEALQRQAVVRIDARRAQDDGRQAGLAQTTLGIDPAAGTRRLGVEATRFVDGRTTAIAIDPGGANVDQAAW